MILHEGDPARMRARRSARVPRWVSYAPSAVVLFMIAKWYRGSDSIVRQHDNLDFLQPVLHQLGWADLLAAPGSELGFILGGLPRDLFGSEFLLSNVIGVALPMTPALVATELVIRLIAFYGMIWLLREVGLSDRPLVITGTASVFALLPFYVPAFGAVAALPLLIAAVLRQWDADHLDRRSMVVFVALPFVSPIYATIPYIAVLGLVAVVAMIVRRDRGRRLVALTAMLGAVTVFVDWRLLYAAVFEEPTHRTEMALAPRALGLSMFGSPTELLFGEVAHAAAGKTLVLAFSFGLGAMATVLGWKHLDRRRRWLIGLSAGFVIVSAFATRLWRTVELELIRSLVEDWEAIQMERIRWIEPAVIYLLFAFAIAMVADLVESRTRRRWLANTAIAVLIVAQGWSVYTTHTFVEVPNSMSIKTFYATETMSDIRTSFDGDDGVRVVSVGIHPAVAINAGIPSADGYWTAYPLSYKRAFRDLIAPALDADDDDARYYDSWGSRAYVFQPEVARPSPRYPPRGGAADLVVNRDAFATLGITHIVSSVEFINAEDVGLTLLAVHEVPDELGPIRLYRVD